MRGALIEGGVPVWQADGLIEDYAHYSRSEAAELACGVRRQRENRHAALKILQATTLKRFPSPQYRERRLCRRWARRR
jgi:hypothetical protein